MTSAELDRRCDQAKSLLHKFIDLVADREFFMVEFWHVYRTTGMLLANASPQGYRLFNGDLIRFDVPIEESMIVPESLETMKAILDNPIGHFNYELEKAKWQESIKMMQHEQG